MARTFGRRGYVGGTYPESARGAGGGGVGSLPPYADALWVDNTVSPTPSSPDGSIGSSDGTTGPFQNITDAITVSQTDRSNVAVLVGSSDGSEAIVVPPDFSLFVQQLGPETTAASYSFGGGGGGGGAVINALGGYGIGAVSVTGNFAQFVVKGLFGIGAITTTSPSNTEEMVFEGIYPQGPGASTVVDNLGGGAVAAGVDMSFTNNGIANKVSCNNLSATDCTFHEVGGVTADITIAGFGFFDTCSFSAAVARTMTIGSAVVHFQGCSFSDTSGLAINNSAGVASFDSTSYKSFLANGGTFTSAANVRVIVKLQTVTVSVTVPTLGAGISQYVNVDLSATSLAGITQDSPVAVNSKDDFVAAGAAGGFMSGAPRISALNTLRILFVGSITGAAHNFEVTQLG